MSVVPVSIQLNTQGTSLAGCKSLATPTSKNVRLASTTSLRNQRLIFHRTDLRLRRPFNNFNHAHAQQSTSSASVAIDPGNSLSSSQTVDSNEVKETPHSTPGDDTVETCDKLIEVFLVIKPNPDDWRKLLAFSKQWTKIRAHFYKRCRVRADMEADLEMKQKLLKLYRVLNEIDSDMQNHNELLREVKKRPSEIEVIVGRRRKDFSVDFFEYLKLVASSYYDNIESQDEIMSLARACWKAVQTYDNATDGGVEWANSTSKVEEMFSSPMESSQSIDKLAGKSQLDPSAASLLSKAWGVARDTNMNEEEARDVMIHLYKNTVRNLQRNIPKEVRILKYILDTDDPMELTQELVDAFTPGEETEGEECDMLYTSPRELHKWIKLLLDFQSSNAGGTLIQEAKRSPDPTISPDHLLIEARKLHTPEVFLKLEFLKRIIEERFL